MNNWWNRERDCMVDGDWWYSKMDYTGSKWAYGENDVHIAARRVDKLKGEATAAWKEWIDSPENVSNWWYEERDCTEVTDMNNWCQVQREWAYGEQDVEIAIQRVDRLKGESVGAWKEWIDDEEEEVFTSEEEWGIEEKYKMWHEGFLEEEERKAAQEGLEDLIRGRKYDQGKLRHDLIPPLWHTALAEVLTHGAEKYGDNNWKGVTYPSIRYYAALQRHLQAHRKGERYDQESGMSHLHHAFTNLGFLITFEDGENE